MGACARCQTQLARDQWRCPTCGLRVGTLLSNVENGPPGPLLRAPPRARRRLRLPLFVALVVVLLAGGLLTPAAGQVLSVVEPARAALGQGLAMIGQAAESQLARRSRLPGLPPPREQHSSMRLGAHA